jgi:hypothetical protein
LAGKSAELACQDALLVSLRTAAFSLMRGDFELLGSITINEVIAVNLSIRARA